MSRSPNESIDQMVNIVVAPDSFKGSLTAKEVALAMRKGIVRAGVVGDIIEAPMADGGEGTMECMVDASGGTKVAARVCDPVGKQISARFGVLGDARTCVIEMAAASGLYLISGEERNPLRTTTYGVGQLIRAGLDLGCRRFIVGLGGSATNDGGAGMLQALGVKLEDEAGRNVGYGGGALSSIARIDASGMDVRLSECEFVVACDVDNPFVGPHGASRVFGPQKGATPEMVAELDRHLEHFADRIAEATGVRIHDMPGAGAAGGLAGAFVALLGGTLRSGFEIVAETVKLEEAVRTADLVFTGEGQTDVQTSRGKTPVGVARIARKHGVPVIVLSGSVGEGIQSLYAEGVSAVSSIVNRPMSLADAMAQTAVLVEQAAEQLTRIYCAGGKRKWKS